MMKEGDAGLKVETEMRFGRPHGLNPEMNNFLLEEYDR